MRDPSLPSTRFGPSPPAFVSAVPAATDLPFRARPLTRKEQRRGDLYLYDSPKLGRTVSVIGALTLAIALELEFSHSIIAFIERPRLLKYGDEEIELGFWQRERSARESFYVLVPDNDVEPRSKIRSHRDARALVGAANSAGISIEFLFETDILAKAASIGTWYRLLPYVQTAHTLPHHHSIEERLLEAFATQRRMTFAQCETALTGLHPADVRAVMSALIHRGILTIDATKPLHAHSVVDVGGRA